MPFVTHSAPPTFSTSAEHEQASSKPSSTRAPGRTSPSQTPKLAGLARTASRGSCA